MTRVAQPGAGAPATLERVSHPVPVGCSGFGGWKASLFGDLHVHCPQRIQLSTRAKVVTSRWPDPGTSKVDPGLPRTH
jgi:malonate-semialdehyde dehydrogenase (acetylating)/methylmalonate-semialdehyde dehydrogenase